MPASRFTKTVICITALLLSTGLNAAEMLFSSKSLTVEAALQAGQAALAKCRNGGFQVAVAVVDRGGNTQVLLRDRFAGPHTVATAQGKAWTAVSFRTGTSELSELTQPGKPQSAMRGIPGALPLGGGLTIEAAGSIVAGIGVSGAPGGELDDVCAQAGIDAIAADLNF